MRQMIRGMKTVFWNTRWSSTGASADQEEYLRLSRNLYQYRLTVNSEEFTGSGEMIVKDTDFIVLLTQELINIEGLPADMYILGHLTSQKEEYNSHLQLDSPVPCSLHPGIFMCLYIVQGSKAPELSWKVTVD